MILHWHLEHRGGDEPERLAEGAHDLVRAWLARREDGGYALAALAVLLPRLGHVNDESEHQRHAHLRLPQRNANAIATNVVLMDIPMRQSTGLH